MFLWPAPLSLDTLQGTRLPQVQLLHHVPDRDIKRLGRPAQDLLQRRRHIRRLAGGDGLPGRGPGTGLFLGAKVGEDVRLGDVLVDGDGRDADGPAEGVGEGLHRLGEGPLARPGEGDDAVRPGEGAGGVEVLRDESRRGLAELVALGPADAGSAAVVRDADLLYRVPQIEEGRVYRERLVIQPLPHTRPGEPGVRGGQRPQLLLAVQMGAHDLGRGRVPVGQGKGQRRVEDVLDAGAVRAGDGGQLDLDAVLAHVAGVRDEEEHVDAGEDGLEVLRRRLVRGGAGLGAGRQGAELGGVAADEDEGRGRDEAQEVGEGAGAEGARRGEDADRLHGGVVRGLVLPARSERLAWRRGFGGGKS